MVYVGKGELTIWVVTAPMVCPLSVTMSSVPEDNKFIAQGAAVWKSGWAEMDWGMHFELHQHDL